MKSLLALCATAGALAIAAPAFADTVYDPSTGQSYVTSPSAGAVSAPQGAYYVTPGQAAASSRTAGPTPGYANAQGSWGPLEIITAPVRLITAPFGMMQPASGAVGMASGNMVPVNRSCGVQVDFNGRRTAMCGP